MGFAAWAALRTCDAQMPASDPGGRVGRPGRAAITSADHRFMVSGMTSAENMVLAGALAEQAGKVEAKTGMPLPMRRDQMLGVIVQSASSPDTQILKVQGWDDGHFYQRLVVPGRFRLDEEDLLEAACWLLLNRYAAEYTPAGQRTGMGAAVPDWISTGLAQDSQASLRSRNRDWIARELAENRVMPLAQVIKQEQLPPGRWREKAYAAAAVEFLFPAGDLQAWAALSQAVGTRQAIDATWLRRTCAVLRDRKPEAAWREHLQQSTRARAAESWSDRGLQLEEKLLQNLNFRPRELTGPIPDEVPQELYARDLVEYRGQPWTRPVAAALAMQMQSLELGAPSALREVLEFYAAFFEQLGVPPAEKTAWWKHSKKNPKKIQPPDDATWQVALNQLWMRAERAHQGFLETHQTRKRYVDSFDRATPGEFGDSTLDDSTRPRTRWQKYVDGIEERWERATFP